MKWHRKRKWHRETFVCSLRQHVTPAANVGRLRPEDTLLGHEAVDGHRFARCLRCDAWMKVPAPKKPTSDTLPPLEHIKMPRRGRKLRDAIVMRIIAINKGLHSLVFGLICGALITLDLKLPILQDEAGSLLKRAQDLAKDTGPEAGRNFMLRTLDRVLHLDARAIKVLIVTAGLYCIVEAVEAVGLWLEKRWAEYLTVLATAGFMPFEIDELIKKVTWVRIGALVINVALIAWLVWNKRLFGVRGGGRAMEGEEETAIVLRPVADKPSAAAAVVAS